MVQDPKEPSRADGYCEAALVRDNILADALDKGADGQPLGCAELAGDLVGVFRSGREDLATNKELLREATLADASP